MDINQLYLKIILKEAKLHSWEITDNEYYNGLLVRTIYNPSYINGIARQLLEIAKSNLVERSFCRSYHISTAGYAYETVAAHTNLACAVLDRALAYQYGPYFETINEGFTYREILEAMRRHDLPENTFGDIPDDGNREDEILSEKEYAYWRRFSCYSSDADYRFEEKVNSLLERIKDKKTPISRAFFLADKVSAIITAYVYDQTGIPITKAIYEFNSDIDLKAMEIADYCEEGHCRASEMWTISYFKLRNTIQYDDTGFFTAIIIMISLMTNQKWFDWRMKDYQD